MAKNTLTKTKERSSQDELEILREIIQQDPYLLDRVLGKIREHRADATRGIADIVSEKTGAKREEERRKGSGT